MRRIAKFCRTFVPWMTLVLALLCSHATALADSASGSVSVIISDPSGALVPNAKAEIRNLSTGQIQTVTSNKSGIASFAFVAPGRYALTISRPNFSDVVIDNILLNVGDERRFQVILKVGPTAQTVTVDGSGLALNTTDASLSTVIDRKFVSNLPLNGRSFQDLISMTPGVVTASPQTSVSASVQTQGDFSVNGQRTESNYYTVDGVSANTGAGNSTGTAQAGTAGAIPSSTALGTTQSLISVDALQEFRVSSSTYSAEYGRSPGGQFSLASRSGTNVVHGTIFDYLRNDVFDANNWFNNYNHLSKTPLRQNDFGGTFGGPITVPLLYSGKDRSFFFISYEGLRVVQPTAATTQYVPALAVRQAAPSPTKEILNAFPLPTGPELTTSTGDLSGLASFVEGYSLPAQIDAVSVRLDERLTSRVSAFIRYGHTPTSTATRLLSSLAHQIQNSDTYTAGLDVALSNRSSNSTRLGISHSTSQQTMALDNFGGATPISLKDSFGVPGTYSTFQYYPYLYISGVGSSYIQQYNASNKLDQWNLTDTYALTVGHHQIRAGVDERRIHSPLNPTQISVAPDFYSRSAMLSGTTTDVLIEKQDPAEPLFNEFSAFVQDEWNVMRTLNISAGLRWEVNPPPSTADGKMAYTATGNPLTPSTLELAPRGTALWKTSWYNFAPRLGVAWRLSPHPGRETVLRTGMGVFFDAGNQTAAYGFSGLGFSAYVDPTNLTLPVPSSAFNFTTDVTPPYTAGTVYVFPTHLQLPYTLQWNTSIDRSLGASQIITVSYVGSAGRRLLQQRQATNVSAFNPLFRAVIYYPNGLTSNYQALQLKYQRSVTHGIQALASYTWSHSLDYGSTNSTYAYSYGNSDFDVRHNFQSGLSWDLPHPRTHSVANAIIGDWGIDGRLLVRSAFPLTLLGNVLTDATGARYYSGVNYDPSKPVYLYGKYPGGKALNGGPKVSAASAAFTLPSGKLSGNAPRNFVRTFGAAQVNVALRRDIRIVDSLSMQLRAETFNIFNHPIFGYVDPSLTSATFGQTTKTLNSSLASMSSLYQQGGPRSMQFSLKLSF